MYAILSHGGRQYRVSAGDRLVVDRLDAQVGSVVGLEPVLLTGGDGTTALGKDLEGMRVAATVVAHRRGEKLRIFKYKAKKRSRKVAGYRSDLTELRVDSILAKGAALPKAAATTERASSAPSTAKPQSSARRAPAARVAVADKPAKTATPRATAKPKAAPKTAATAKTKPATKRAPKSAAAEEADSNGA